MSSDNLGDLMKRAGLKGFDIAKLQEHVTKGGPLGTPCMSCAVKLLKIRGLIGEVSEHMK